MKQVSIKHCNTSQNTSRNRQNYITRKFYLHRDVAKFTSLGNFILLPI